MDNSGLLLLSVDRISFRYDALLSFEFLNIIPLLALVVLLFHPCTILVMSKETVVWLLLPTVELVLGDVYPLQEVLL